MIEFPDPELADENGLLAVGGNLEPETLLAAYSKGIFPWYSEDQPILWWSPDPRMVLFPIEFHCSRRLARRIRQPQYRFSWDEAFAEVVATCAAIPRKGESGTWILPEMVEAYTTLHEQGYAHSVEVWKDNLLIGGLYGVLHRNIFFAESMFSRKRDGSKMALAKLVERGLDEKWHLIDCQFHTSHLESLGAREISRKEFIGHLAQKPKGEESMDEQSLVMEHPLFRLLPDATRADLVVNGSQQTFHDGEMIIEEDSMNPSLFLICSGSVRILMNGTEVAMLHANELLGEISTAGISPPTATVTAVGNVTLYAFPADKIRQLTIRYPEFAAALKESGLKKVYG